MVAEWGSLGDWRERSEPSIFSVNERFEERRVNSPVFTAKLNACVQWLLFEYDLVYQDQRLFSTVTA